MIHQLIIGTFTVLLFATCSPTKKIQTASNPVTVQDTIKKDIPYQFPYTINAPQQSMKLANILKEISGLSMSEDDNILYAIQDENGIVFQLDKSTGKIIKQKRFHDDGDYEGIEMVGDKIYIVKSSGNIYEVNDLWTEKPERKKFKFFLTKENNIEGLTYNAVSNKLILSAKGFSPAKEENKNNRVIYSFDLATNTLEEDPIFVYEKKDMEEFVKTKVPKENRHLFAIANPGKGEFKLGPSGIAIHPITKNYYTVSSRGKVLIVCHPDGSLLHFEKLNKKIHIQPEGITFDKAGNLYISNEGDKEHPAKLYRFDFNSKK